VAPSTYSYVSVRSGPRHPTWTGRCGDLRHCDLVGRAGLEPRAVPDYAHERVSVGLATPGVLVVCPVLSIAPVIEEVLLIAGASEPEERKTQFGTCRCAARRSVFSPSQTTGMVDPQPGAFQSGMS